MSSNTSRLHLRSLSKWTGSLLLGTTMLGTTVQKASATEKGASTYPVGVDTVLSGEQPSKGKTSFYNYTNTYFANESDGADGKPDVSEFKLRVVADAFKIVHDWGVPFLGGTLHSNIAVPVVFQDLHTPAGQQSKTALGNVSIAVLGTSYHGEHFSWYYEGDVYLPGGSYDKNDIANPGAHNFAGGPVAAFTYLPFKGHTEISSKGQYLFNATNSDTNYHGGNEFTWEYDAMQSLNRHFAAGVNGYLFLQTTDDKVSGVVYNSGNRGRDLAIGPELRLHFGNFGGALKYERDTLVQNRSRGNALWFQFSLPVNHLFGKKL